MKEDIKEQRRHGCFRGVPPNDYKSKNIMSSRFFVTSRNMGMINERSKARLVEQGHTDIEKPFIIHSTSTMNHSSLRLILSFASISGYPIWIQHVNQAYVQSDEPLRRPIYILPPKELRTSPEILRELLKLLCRVCISEDYWYETLKKFLTNKLNRFYLPSDKSIFITGSKS